MDLCKPTTTILLVSAAGSLYHLMMGEMDSMTWWIIVGALGTLVFQSLCYGGMEGLAWVLMLVPVLVVCFFFAVALFSSYLRISTGRKKAECERPRCQKCKRDECVCDEMC